MDQWLPGGGVRGTREQLLKRTGVSFRCEENSLKVDCGNSRTTLNLLTPIELCVTFMTCVLCINKDVQNKKSN